MSLNIVSCERPVEKFLARLERVRETGPGRWIACCPSHEDRSPSLSIRESDDGRVLLHCHAGCAPEAVLAALGLSWTELFPAAGRRRSRHLTPVERKAAARAQAEAELRRRLDAACEALHRRLCVYVRAIRLALDGADLATYERLAGWVHTLPYLEYLLDSLEAADLEARLWAAREARRWLLT